MFGEISVIDENDLDWGNIRRRQPLNSMQFWRAEYERDCHPDIYAKVQRKFGLISENVEFHITSEFVSDLRGNFENVGYGETNSLGRKQRIYISLELTEPLLKDNITAAENLLATHFLTTVIVHELAVR